MFTVTVSDTRTENNDLGGSVLRTCLSEAGFVLVRHEIVRDERDAICAVVRSALDDANVHAVVLTGGTGIAPRDVTYEAVTSMLDKTLDGFGEAFRRLSWDDIGPPSILSRAVAGTVGTKIVAALPGSPKGVRLGVTQVLVPVLPHMVALAQGL